MVEPEVAGSDLSDASLKHPSLIEGQCDRHSQSVACEGALGMSGQVWRQYREGIGTAERRQGVGKI